MKRLIFFLAILFFASQHLIAQQYIFYLHGRIVEVQGANAVETTNGYGAYKYNDIVDSLKSHGYIVVSEVRPKETNVNDYAIKVCDQIQELIKNGVPSKNITVIGASKGSLIAMYVSSKLKNPALNFVFMAACTESDESTSEIRFYGNVLSIYEQSDYYKDCSKIRTRSSQVKNYKELEINTGLKHGFLYRPIQEWLAPTLKWASGDYQ